MNYVIVVSELQQLPPPKRWSMLVAPLAEELDNSGLGRIIDLDCLRREANELGRIEAEELAVELVHLGYGRELVKDVVSAAGLKPCKPETPKRWLDYHCEDYFREGWCERGHLDEASHTLVFAPLTEAYENPEIEFFVVGTSGWDGIDFGYRRGQAGLWAYYPIEREFKFMAPTVAELVEGWCSGRLSV